MSLLGAMQAIADGAVAAVQASPGWEAATVALPGAAAALDATVFVLGNEEPAAGRQRRNGTILVTVTDCPDEPTDGTTITLDADGTVWTVRTALRQSVTWRVSAWAPAA